MHLRYGLFLVALAACSSTSYGNNPPAAPPPPPPPAAGTVFVTISNYQFAPDSITIAAGTPVQWKNTGNVAHTATADDGSTFDSGSLGSPGTDAYGNPTAGATFTRTFSTSGKFHYHCTNHPTLMTGVVVVTP